MQDQEHDRLLNAVERVAVLLTESGMPRMASRVFVYALAEDAERYTAAELAEGLRVSPAAISGAVRYLVMVRLLFKERAPGTRADLYRVYDDDVWSTILLARLPMLEQCERAAAQAAAEIGEEHRGARRLSEMQEFFTFTREETEAMVQRWQERRRTLS